MNISTDHVHPKQKSSVKSARSADCRHEPDDWRRGGHPLRHAWHGAGPEAWRTDRGQVEGRYGLRFMYIYTHYIERYMSSDYVEIWFFSGIVPFSKKTSHTSVFLLDAWYSKKSTSYLWYVLYVLYVSIFEDFYRDHLTPRSQLHPLQVSFEESSAEPAKNLNVQSFEIQPAKELLGDPVNQKPGRIMIHGDWDLCI